MKEKYIVKELNGWWYEGKFYNCDTVVELTKSELTELKGQVRLEAAQKQNNNKQ
jgi:hypothetical protein